MKGPNHRRAALLIGLTLLAVTGRALADADADERGRRAREIAESINSPFCPASTLASCGSPNAANWRAEIRQWVDEGLTKNEICARLEERVGQRLCVGPRSPWSWSVPFLIAAASIGLLALVLRRFVRPATEPAGGAPPPSSAAALDDRLNRELDELDDD